ncbi:biotin synthase BioB [Paramaledivibacter caminithermalis]|jgi:biotin synthase|uniref:Biotin synthase n=1 Tax=Paramaledivibacter caminithermalis (strain DSM 15212 / CIP 107654 / DViRD3) TaxID=1121301 RepID=A0A1M6LQG3_PARC5|nr:biotin synthase BioB [Paramaledivibacter caminithermalis]SHJ73439.1 biotin synthase [Paramaledivibacter caminithermalis DSM 15212]
MDMKKIISEVTQRILNGGEITYDEAIKLINIDENDEEILEELFCGANKIRKQFVGKKADLCTIMNTKSGKCSEDCKFCAQSAHYETGVDEYELLDYDRILERAKEMEKSGVHRFSLVTSGKGIRDKDFEKIVDIYKKLSRDTNLKLCASHGIVNYEQATKLKEAGVSMYHHNLETSKDYYSEICTTHTYEDRIETIKNVMKAGLEICCGGIIGMGETREDRLKMAFEIKELGIKSVPLNVLNPIKGTPLEDIEVLSPNEILKTMALYRYIIPNCYIRYAGGRMALKDKQNIGFKAGVNGALTGNYLTTIGNNIKQDKEMIMCEGFEL